jgi:hypothetical protein
MRERAQIVQALDVRAFRRDGRVAASAQEARDIVVALGAERDQIVVPLVAEALVVE